MTRAAPRDHRRRRVVIVGAGLAGLAAACHLVGRGHDVVVVERDHAPGGRAMRLQQDGFTFDTGPTVLTMPGLLQETVRAAGAQLEDLVTLRSLDPAYRACFADGSTIQVRAGLEAMTAEIRTVCGPREADAFVRFCAWAKELYRLEMQTYIDRNYDHAWQLATPPSAALKLLRTGALRSLHNKAASFFEDERLRRLFTFQALYAGMSPFQARAVYAVISYMDTVAGVFTPEGGIGAVPAALATAAEKPGTEFRYGVEVDRVVRAGKSSGRVLGVVSTEGERLSADAVVVTLDRPVAYERLLPGLTDPHPRRLTYSPSALVWHVGVRGRPDVRDIAHHNIHFGADWRGAFDALLRDRQPMPDPSVLVTVPTASHPELAPPGDTSLYVLEPVPSLGGEPELDWTVTRGRLRERLKSLLTRWGYLDGDIVTEQLVDPTDWAGLGMAAGTPFSVAHTFFQSGPFRPANVDRRVPGLVFAGSGTVPGVGVPMVLISGRLAAKRVEECT